MPDLDRNRLIALLKRLEGPDEKDVIEAAREIAGRMKEAGVSWDELLAPSARPPRESGDRGATFTARGDESEAADPDAGAGDTLSAEETAEARAEIKALLAVDRISETTQGEIIGLRGDLDEGRLSRADLRYVRALRARLS